MVCPLAGYTIDENAARWTAAVTAVGALAALAASQSLGVGIALFLAADFATRAFSRPRWSPAARLVATLLSAFRIAPRRVDAGPKRFAARIGLGLLLLLALALALDAPSLALASGIILIACATLEAALGFCVGCWLWSAWWQVRERTNR